MAYPYDSRSGFGPAPAKPAAPSRPIAGYGATGGGTVTRQPNYGALLGGDDALQGTLQSLSAQGAQGDLGYNAARNAALIGYGGTPAGVNGVDPVTRQNALDATATGLSSLGQLQHGYHQAQSGIVGSLAGRSILHSGAYLQHSRENLYDLTKGTANAQMSLEDHLAQLAQSHLASQEGLSQQGYTATSDALNRIIQQINAGLIAPRTSAAPVRLRNAAQVTRNQL